MDTLSVASFIVGVAGVMVALYQGFEKKKIDQYVKNQAWNNYSLVLRAWGSQQSAFNKYKSLNSPEINGEMLENLAKAETFLHCLHLEAIRQIQLSEKNFDIATISLWQHIGRITESQAKSFLETAPFNTPGIFSSMKLYVHRYLQEKILYYQEKFNKTKQGGLG